MSQARAYRVCVIGLGSMGMGAALSCVRAGLSTSGLELDAARRAEFLGGGGAAAAESPAGLDCGFDAVVVLVVNAAQARAALLGPGGLAPRLPKGAAVMLSCTQSAADARALAADLEALGLLVLDAPVSGGAFKAAAGEMTVMASGAETAFARLQPVLDATADKVYRIGAEIGLGATVKVIHQLLAGVHIAAGAEAMALAARAGIPLDLMYDVVTHAAGNSWMFENRMKHVVDGDYAPRSAVDIFVKDLGLVTETGRALKFPLPLASAAFAMFLNASNAGFGREDDSAVIKTFAGISLPGTE
ncbi:putative dehydrogenase, with NAD(P)-binding Rossmann-fold domain [uncultured Alphaproteobacteria bacterium]|uniref:L-threonate dehydrogenase n=1 Tax=uncultured Alphaproteobacteria bacterium TaxID=91750 RepID=A0A212KK35_9PROT|nr:putative dehydrogenase, with NAD(P)-binding Rossmann-fold domain [uncultured Alphaproteobacteria bacterium]